MMVVTDPSDDLFSGFWPIIRRLLFVFLPLWVFLLGYSAGINVIISATLAGASVSVVAIYEKKKLMAVNEASSDGNKVIK